MCPNFTRSRSLCPENRPGLFPAASLETPPGHAWVHCGQCFPGPPVAHSPVSPTHVATASPPSVAPRAWPHCLPTSWGALGCAPHGWPSPGSSVTCSSPAPPCSLTHPHTCPCVSLPGLPPASPGLWSCIPHKGCEPQSLLCGLSQREEGILCRDKMGQSFSLVNRTRVTESRWGKRPPHGAAPHPLLRAELPEDAPTGRHFPLLELVLPCCLVTVGARLSGRG